MGEYEDRYPDAFGRGEETETKPQQRPFRGLPRQVRSEEPVASDAPAVAEGATQAKPPAAHQREPARPVEYRETAPRVFVERPAEEVLAEVQARLAASPYLGQSDVSVSVTGPEVTLDGTVADQFAASVARSLASNVAGVARVKLQLRVQSPPDKR